MHADVRVDRLEAIYYDSYKLPESRHFQLEWVSGRIAAETFDAYPELTALRDRESWLRDCRETFLCTGLFADLAAWHVMGPEAAREGLALKLCLEGSQVDLDRTDLLDAQGNAGHSAMANYLGLSDFVVTELFRGTKNGQLAETRQILLQAIKFCKRHGESLDLDRLHDHLRSARRH